MFVLARSTLRCLLRHPCTAAVGGGPYDRRRHFQAIAVVRRHELRHDAGWLLSVDEIDAAAMKRLDHGRELTVRGWLALSRHLDRLAAAVRDGRSGAAFFAKAGPQGGAIAALSADMLGALSAQLVARAATALSVGGELSEEPALENSSSPELELAIWYAKGVVAGAARTLGDRALLDLAVLHQSSGDYVLAGAAVVADNLAGAMHRRHLALVAARTGADD